MTSGMSVPDLRPRFNLSLSSFLLCVPCGLCVRQFFSVFLLSFNLLREQR
jgi:hypothetical protein